MNIYNLMWGFYKWQMRYMRNYYDVYINTSALIDSV